MSNESAEHGLTEPADRRTPSQAARATNGSLTPQRRKIDCAGNAEVADRRHHVRGGRAAPSHDHR